MTVLSIFILSGGHSLAEERTLASSGHPKRSAEELHAGDDLFTNAAVRHLRIEISKEGADILRQYSWRNRKQVERTYVPATIREGKTIWTNVGVHLKGGYGSFRSLDEKPGFTLNFDKFSEGQRFHGLQKLSLNNSVQDGSYLSDNIARGLHNSAGVPTPRLDYATVELNGRYLGLYLLSEGWNKQFLRRHFTNVKGNFYDFGGAHDIDKPTPASFGENRTNHTALGALVAATREKDHTKRIAQMRKTLDMDRFLTMMALETLTWNWDGYANNKNNYRAFVDLDKNRVVFLPHSIDMTFSKPDAPIVTGRAGLVMRALLETDEGRLMYLERMRELRTNIFSAAAIQKRIEELNARLEPVLAKDGMFWRQQSSANWYRSLMIAREREVDAQLAGIRNLWRLDQNAKAAITNWVAGPETPGVSSDKTGDAPVALHLKKQPPFLDFSHPGENSGRNPASTALWQATLWLEEGRCQVQARVKTRRIHALSESTNSGAGLRIWSTRKMTQGSSWSWLGLEAARDPIARGLIPVFTNTVQPRLTGDTDWTTITHEFDLRQPIADIQIQCVIENATGEAWFDLASLQIQRWSRNGSKPVLAKDDPAAVRPGL